MDGYYTSAKLIHQPVPCFVKWTGFPDQLGDFDFPRSETVYSYRTGRVAEQLAQKQLTDLGEGSSESSLSILKNAIDQNRDKDPYHLFSSPHPDLGIAKRPDYSAGWDTGHEYQVTKQLPIRFSHKARSIPWVNPSFGSYSKVQVTPKNMQYGPVPDIDLDVFGTKAIAATIPTRPTVDFSLILGQAFGQQELPELRLPVIADKAAFFRELGPAYLNLQYGWIPFAGDLKKIMQAVLRIQKDIDQYARDGSDGRTVRRRFEFDPFDTDIISEDQTASPSVGPYFVGYFGSQVLSQYGNINHYTRRVNRKISFSGEYQYYLPTSKDWLSRMARYAELAEHILGLRLTPEVVWELIPWSWLADWFVDLGPIIGNYSAFGRDGLLLKYGYITCRSTMYETYSCSDSKFFNWDPGTISATLITKQTRRVRATPFGFGVDPSTWGVFEWSILGALGMTNGPTSLRRK